MPPHNYFHNLIHWILSRYASWDLFRPLLKPPASTANEVSLREVIESRVHVKYQLHRTLFPFLCTPELYHIIYPHTCWWIAGRSFTVHSLKCYAISSNWNIWRTRNATHRWIDKQNGLPRPSLPDHNTIWQSTMKTMTFMRSNSRTYISPKSTYLRLWRPFLILLWNAARLNTRDAWDLRTDSKGLILQIHYAFNCYIL